MSDRKQPHSRRLGWACAAALMLLAVGSSTSRAGQDSGAIAGVIVDESGGVLPGVSVTAVPEGGGAVQAGVSDGFGEYEIANLPAGRYQVRGVLPGFSSEIAYVAVEAGAVATANLLLGLAPLTETVTVTRADQDLAAVPQSVAVVAREQIEFAQRRSSLDEALRGIPGLFVQNRRNYGLSGGIGLSIRAPEPRFGLRGLALIQDGIPITTADGTTEPGNVDLGSVGRIDVIRGPSSVLYGNSAGGVINLTTTFDTSRPLVIRPDVQFGSYGYNRQQVRVDAGGDGPTQFMTSVSRFETDGFRDNSHAEITQANFVVRRELGDATEIRGVFNYYDSPFAESASFLNEEDARDPVRRRMARGVAAARNWGEGANQGQGGVTLEHRFTETQMFRVTGWGMWRDLDAVGAFRNVNLRRNGRGLRSEYVGGATAGTAGVDWAAGVDVASQNDDRREFGQVAPAVSGERATSGDLRVDQTEDVRSAGPFAQIGVAPTDRVRFTAGVRWDYYDFRAGDRKLDDGDQSGDRKMDAFSPSIGLTVAAAPNVNFFTSFATAYETPTTVELSNTPTGEGGFNQELGPQDLRSFEVGIRGPRRGGAPALRGGGVRVHRRRRPRLVPEPDRGGLLPQRRRVVARRRRAAARVDPGPRLQHPARLHLPELQVRAVRARRQRFRRQHRAGVAAPPHLRRLQPHRPVRPALGDDGPVGRRLHPQQRQHGVQLGVHGRRPAVRVRCDRGRRRRPPVLGHRQPVRRDLQLVDHHQRVRRPLLRAFPGPRVLRGADHRRRPTVGIGAAGPGAGGDPLRLDAGRRCGHT